MYENQVYTIEQGTCSDEYMEAADSYWLERLTEEEYAGYRPNITCLLDSENEKSFVKSQDGANEKFGQVILSW